MLYEVITLLVGQTAQSESGPDCFDIGRPYSVGEIGTARPYVRRSGNGGNQRTLVLEQFLAVEVYQVVALFNLDAGEVHVQSVNPAGNPGSDVLDPRLVVV